MGFTIRVEGTEALIKGLNSKVKADAVKQAVKKNGAALTRNAQRNAPVDTGTLKRSITLAIEDGGMTARTTAHADYSAYVEYGTRFMNAQPYMRPAYDEQLPKFKSDLQEAVRKKG